VNKDFKPYLEEPPFTTRWSEMLAFVDAAPKGAWLVIREYTTTNNAHSSATALRKKFPDYEFAGHCVEGKSKLYARKKVGHGKEI